MTNILITGVSSGIGYDAVSYFIKKGYRVFGSVRKEADVSRLNLDFPENFVCLKFDVVNIEEVKLSYQLVRQYLNSESLIALVNNAGYAQSGPMALISDADFRYQMEVNLFGVRNVTNVFLPLLGAKLDFKTKPGKIINISSISGIFNTPMNGAYCVSKHALESLAEVYRRELMIYGIQVCSIQPGPIQSDLWDKNINSMNAYFNTDYEKYARKTSKIIQHAQKNAIPALVISKLIEKIINSKKPKLSYIVTKNKLINTIVAKYVPNRIMDKLIFKSFSKK